MSQDEIVFGEITYREPERRRRPDKDRRFACVAYELPVPADLPIFLDRAAADAIERHALSDTSVELGGILLGKECVDDQSGEPFVLVTKSLEAKHYENTQASFTYTHDSWEEITRERDRVHPDLDVVGWYHTHPDFGIFLSGHDLFIQHNFFGQPLQVAYVVDPIRQTRGFFQWRDGAMAQVGGFHLFGDRRDRLALARLANDLENLPNPDGSGGGLSPRLEAELIAMLSRPHTYSTRSPSMVERGASGALFALLGAALGVIGLSAILWLNQLSARVADHSRLLEEVGKSIRDTTERQRLAVDALLENNDTNPQRFLGQYAKASKEREELRGQYANQVAIAETLGARAKSLSEELARLRTDFDDTRKRAEGYEKEARAANEFRERFASAKAQTDAQAQKITELEELLDTAAGREASALKRRYETTWYAAVAGWVVAALFGLGLLGGYAFLRPQPGDDADQSGDPANSGGPAIRIT